MHVRIGCVHRSHPHPIKCMFSSKPNAAHSSAFIPISDLYVHLFGYVVRQAGNNCTNITCSAENGHMQYRHAASVELLLAKHRSHCSLQSVRVPGGGTAFVERGNAITSVYIKSCTPYVAPIVFRITHLVVLTSTRVDINLL